MSIFEESSQSGDGVFYTIGMRNDSGVGKNVLHLISLFKDI